jgi:inorganic pyrophosphatase
VDFVSPLPSPYNYGSVEDTLAPDGDPVDAIVLGPRLPLGARWEGAVQAVYLFLDDGEPDPKLICSRTPLRAIDRRGVEAFFRTYAWMKRGLYLTRGRRGPTRALGFSDWVPPLGGG